MKMEQISLVPIYMNGLMLCKILVYRRSRYALSTTYDCSTTINFLAVLLNSSSSNPTIDSLALPGCQQTELQKINKAYLWPRSKCWIRANRASIQHAATKVTNIGYYIPCGRLLCYANQNSLLHMFRTWIYSLHSLIWKSRI